MTQEIETIETNALMDKVRSLHTSKHRLAQICATEQGDNYELLYSFDFKGQLTNFRINLPIPTDGTQPRLQSISAIYAASVLYENELHDLFGIQVDGMAIDFHGNLYKTAIKYPMGSKKAPVSTGESR